MTVFFISDLHLSERITDSYNLFVKFFTQLPQATTAIYILGDFFEYWVDDRVQSRFIDNIKQILFTASQLCPIYFIKGNRDFLLGEKFARQTNIIILPDFYKLKLYDNDILLLHGDYLCALDKWHMYFTKFIRSATTIAVANMLPIKLKLYLANIIRSLSKRKKINKYRHGKVEQHQDIYDVCTKTVHQLVKQYAVNMMIHGHTHKPNTYYDQSVNFTRIVLGEWQQQATILKFDEHCYELITIS